MWNLFHRRSGKVNFAMIAMTEKTRMRAAAFFLGFLAVAWPVRLAGQTAGRIEFTAQVAPTGGRPEPVRQLTFCLLRKSLEDIRVEALQSTPAPDLDSFVDGLSVSPELKAWMKSHHSVQLGGEDFAKSLSPSDIVDIPEFFKAYMTRNLGFKGAGFPNPKFKEKDREANPEKYEQAKAEYNAGIRKFISAAPETVQGIDVDLMNINPYAKWEGLVRQQRQHQDARTTELAGGRYLVAQADTDLDGHGSFAGITPGNYWIGILGAEAISGDVRLRWDFPVTVRSGETARVELSNFNAMKTAPASQAAMH